MSLVKLPIRFARSVSWVDVCLLGLLLGFLYLIINVAAQWTGPYQSSVEINLSITALPWYAFLSLSRGLVAYCLSLLFTFAYGYVAAQSKVAERVLIPLLDILQSIPVLGFLPALVLALVTTFPHSNLGLELACILMIFTGQVWNMTFSFYSSVKSVPTEYRQMTALYRLNRWEIFKGLELPYSMNGLLWNSMLSMAGGWFFLMVVESFSLGQQHFRLPGIGSYMSVAIEKADTGAILAGISAMVLIIVFVDRCFWAPLVYLSQKYKAEPGVQIPDSEPVILTLLDRSDLLRAYYRFVEDFKRRISSQDQSTELKKSATKYTEDKYTIPFWSGFQWVFGFLCIIGALYGTYKMYELITLSHWSEWLGHFVDCFYTFFRVMGAVLLGSVWAIPVGVWIGSHPKWTRRLQPVVQVVAAFPAPMLFPIIVFAMESLGVNFSFTAVVLMLVGSQWYILFNVIGGATLIPSSLKEVALVYQVKGFDYWKAVVIPAIFPSLLNGWITAAGGAWNASIVSEYMHYGKEILQTQGIGSSITLAAQSANFSLLAGGIVTMILVLVLLNRVFWKRLYMLAETRYSLEAS